MLACSENMFSNETEHKIKYNLSHTHKHTHDSKIAKEWERINGIFFRFSSSRILFYVFGQSISIGGTLLLDQTKSFLKIRSQFTIKSKTDWICEKLNTTERKAKRKKRRVLIHRQGLCACVFCLFFAAAVSRSVSWSSHHRSNGRRKTITLMIYLPACEHWAMFNIKYLEWKNSCHSNSGTISFSLKRLHRIYDLFGTQYSLAVLARSRTFVHDCTV